MSRAERKVSWIDKERGDFCASQQFALFHDDDLKQSQKWRISAVSDEIISAYDFDFERDGDRASVIPDPTWKIPPWLALPTDDMEWMPDEYANLAKLLK